MLACCADWISLAGVKWLATKTTRAGSKTRSTPIFSNSLMANGAVMSLAIARSTCTSISSPASTVALPFVGQDLLCHREAHQFLLSRGDSSQPPPLSYMRSHLGRLGEKDSRTASATVAQDIVVGKLVLVDIGEERLVGALELLPAQAIPEHAEARVEAVAS